MKYVSYLFGVLVGLALINLLDRWVRAYEKKIESGIDIDRKVTDNMLLTMTDLIEFPPDH